MKNLFSGSTPASSTDIIQSRLIKAAAGFLFVYSLVITLSPAVRARSWAVAYRWEQWIGYLVWLAGFVIAHRWLKSRLPERDPYLLPIAALLTGWGLLEIWRISPSSGLRQTLWLAVSLGLFSLGLRFADHLGLLRRYKYIFLTGGLLLTSLTLFFGTYPDGVGPHLWLGCCGIYLQPSEPLKLLLIVYLAAYLADYWLLSPSLPQLLLPTLGLIGVSLLLLVAQRDLGTAILFIAISAIILYIASGRRRVIAASVGLIAVAGAIGYLGFDVVRLRIEAWLNPWLDPSGRSYQIVQSLIAIASGGFFGRGPGLGNPGLVPIAHSDFIFAAIAEETGLLGATGLILLVGLLVLRGLRTALHAPDSFQRYLAAGCASYLGAQSLLIIGGNLRLFPLTGVTLPFVSYGGSSLVTSFLALLLLVTISSQPEREPAWLPSPKPYLYVSGTLLAGLALAAVMTGWWSEYHAPALVQRSDNPRRALSDVDVKRGSLLDRSGSPLDYSSGSPGQYQRISVYPPLSPVLGYTQLAYGQAGLEASLDPVLRGLQDNPSSLIWWNALVYSQPPPGLDIRLSLDLNLQKHADALLGSHTGALVLLNAQTGEILAMASHPYFDPNRLDQDWNQLISDPSAPLLNRATQGKYPPGTVLGPFLLAQVEDGGSVSALPENQTYTIEGQRIECVRPLSANLGWFDSISAGCPGSLVALGERLGAVQLMSLFTKLGFYSQPAIPLPSANPSPASPIEHVDKAALGMNNLTVSPLQMALASAALSTDGLRPAPRIVLATNITNQGWMVTPHSAQPTKAYTQISPNFAGCPG
ncbi:MAG: FtsW/RodA/SpoVE family cell cycle protein, partial [Chloroflexi bacterium]|nr:FtsW/RodA/SpoVE family cell cycle protein [Chloroflexota bacterium]